jgi:intraflagellar transport protein 172
LEFLIDIFIYPTSGDFYERQEEFQRALDSYIRGSAYRKAVELARRSFPSRVVELQVIFVLFITSFSII